MRAIATCLMLAACGGAPKPAPAAPAAPPVANAATAPAPAPAPAAAPAPAGDAATPYETALLHGHPTPDTFQQLYNVLPSLPTARQAALRALGAKIDAPIHVPTIQFEYVWVAQLACDGGEGKVGMQALVDGPHGQLDELSYTCPGSTDERRAYFDYSDDPSEKAMQEELGKP